MSPRTRPGSSLSARPGRHETSPHPWAFLELAIAAMFEWPSPFAVTLFEELGFGMFGSPGGVLLDLSHDVEQ